MDLMERFFAEITRHIRRGSYSSIFESETAIYDHLPHNTKPKPFRLEQNRRENSHPETLCTGQGR